MDLMFFVNRRLDLLNYFYDTTVSLFEDTKRKIEVGEEPYVDTGMGDPDEHPFRKSGSAPHSAADLAGATSLDLLQLTFHQFLEEFMREIGGQSLVPKMGEMKQGSWFANYRAFFLKELEIDWTASGADVALFEQAILTRNDFTHNFSFTTLAAFQTGRHAQKYPLPAFGDGRPAIFKKRLTVEKETLEPRRERAAPALRIPCS